MLAKLTIQKRLIAAFAVVVVLFVALSFYMLGRMAAVDTDVDNITASSAQIALVDDVNAHVLERNRLVLWALAAVGIGFKAFHAGKYDLVSTIAYVLLGWSGLAAIVPLYHALPGVAFVLVLAGGLFYTVGAAVYRWETLPHNHAIWHVLCLSGSVCHFIAVCFLLA